MWVRADADGGRVNISAAFALLPFFHSGLSGWVIRVYSGATEYRQLPTVYSSAADTEAAIEELLIGAE